MALTQVNLANIVTGTLPVANGGTGTTTSTGSGNSVLSTSPTITSPTIDKINTSVANTSLGAGNSSIMKNRIINGAMVIDQRNAGASVTPTASAYTLDRWFASISQSSKFSVQQNAGSITPPVGFVNYLGATSLSAYTVGASEFFQITQQIEGFNVSDLGWGTASAKTITLSFQVYSSLTGTFGGVLANGAFNRSYPFSYSIPVANTWTTISITIAGDTSGTWLTTNGIGIYTMFSLGAGATVSGTAGSWAGVGYRSATGATSVVGTNGATFYITGVQLEVGSSATGFEYRQYTQELALCQRYCMAYTADSSTNYTYFSIGQVMSTTNSRQVFIFKQTMRALPTVTTSAANTFIWDAAGGGITVTALSLDRTTTQGCTLSADVASSSVANNAAMRMIQNAGSTCYVIFSAEL